MPNPRLLLVFVYCPTCVCPVIGFNDYKSAICFLQLLEYARFGMCFDYILSMYKNTKICDFSVFSLKVLSVPPKQNHRTFCSYLLSISPKEAAVHLLKVRAETRTVKIGWVNIHSVVLLWSGSRCYPAGVLAEEWGLKDEKMHNGQTNGGCICKNKWEIWEFYGTISSVMLIFPLTHTSINWSPLNQKQASLC